MVETHAINFSIIVNGNDGSVCLPQPGSALHVYHGSFLTQTNKYDKDIFLG